MCVSTSMHMCVYLLKTPTKTTGLRTIRYFPAPGLFMCVCVCVHYLRGFVRSPAVLVAVEAGQQHVLICVHLAKA